MEWYDTMVQDILDNGLTNFREKVYEGAYQENAYAILHPEDYLRSNPYFKEIFEAFLNAYV